MIVDNGINKFIYLQKVYLFARNLHRRAPLLRSTLRQSRQRFFVRRNATDPVLLLLCSILVSSHHRCSCSHAWHALHTWIARFLTRSSSTLSGCTRETMPTTCPSSRRPDPTRIRARTMRFIINTRSRSCIITTCN